MTGSVRSIKYQAIDELEVAAANPKRHDIDKLRASVKHHGFVEPIPPYVANTKLYSCNLIRTDLPMRWRGRYNEDVILAIDILKAGWCTCQFNAFLQQKMVTQALPGGNTTELYNGAEKSAARHTQKTGPPPNRKCLHACTQTLRAWCGSSGACTTT